MKAEEVNRLLSRLGASVVGQTGSHRRFEKDFSDPETAWQAWYVFNGIRHRVTTTVQQHKGKDIPRGTLRAIERQMEPAFGKGWLTNAR